MTREEEIREASNELSKFHPGIKAWMDMAYERGALWADNNPKSPWISVKDELPDYGTPVLASYEGAFLQITERHKADEGIPYLDDNGFVIERNGGKYTGDIVHVDYYLLIPELPEGGENEN